MSKKGFLDGLLETLTMWSAVQDSKDSYGKPDASKALGNAWLLNGNLSTDNLLDLAIFLGRAEAKAETPPHRETYTAASAKPLYDASELNGLHPSMYWNTLSETEKERRIAKASYTKACHSSWKHLWKTKVELDKQTPLEAAASIWAYFDEKATKYPHINDEYREMFLKWLRKNHDIRRDSTGQMRMIVRKKKKAIEQ